MEILTTTEMATADQLAIAAGTSGFALMLSAGRAVAEAAMDLVERGPILVVAGAGNNGGDGFVAAAELVARGRHVSVILWGERDALKGDASLAARNWTGSILPAVPESIGRPALIIDALFGAGLNRMVKDGASDLIDAINGAGAPVLSIDLPSGVNGTTGAVMGVAVTATETVTFFRRKPAHLLLPGRIHCGRVRLADIGIAPAVLDDIRPATFENDPWLWRTVVPVPKIDGHKYARGHALVTSGDLAATGAARLAARGALRAGAGLVTVLSPRDALAVNAAALTAIMVRPMDTAAEFTDLLADRRLNACVVGPGAGIGERTSDLVLAVLAAKRRVVLDADALTSFADAPDRLFTAIKDNAEAGTILTPHKGEFMRLFSEMDNKHPFKSKLDRVRSAAVRSGAIVLLKGPDTVIAAPDGRAAIACNAPPWLATAGSGDVLSGIIGGLLAQDVPAFEAACMGVWMHGEAGGEAGPGLIAEDLPEVLPAIWRRLFDELEIDY